MLLHQDFSKAVIAGSRSGSGKLVCESYDALKDIWRGSPNTKPLSMGVHPSEINDQSSSSELGDTENESSVPEEEINGNDPNLSIESTHDADHNGCPEVLNNPTSVIPKLIDNKRKHLERSLSAAQRDALLMHGNRDVKMFRRELTDTLRESKNPWHKQWAVLVNQ